MALSGVLFNFTVQVKAQVGISSNGASPAPSAMLDLDVSALATTAKRGLLCPRMTSAERASIAAPATGLFVYDTTTNSYWHFNGTVWTQLFGPFSGWRMEGNTGVTAGTHFLGTTDLAPLEFRRSNQRAGWLSPSSNNTSWGYLALAANTTGISNTALGSRALAANTTGSRNIAVGSMALSSNISGSNSLAIGANTLQVGTSVVAQTAVGSGAMQLYTSGAGNTAVGAGALRQATPSYCTAVGWLALEVNIGAHNTACGSQCLTDATGSNNTGIGNRTLGNLVVGSNNTAMVALGGILSGSNNTGLGAFIFTDGCSGNTGSSHATLSNVIGSYNTALGRTADNNNLDGDYNAALGHETLDHGFNNPTSVSFLTAAGSDATTGSTSNNQTAIGYNAVALGANVIRIGNAANNTSLTGGFGAWQNVSDARFKFDVQEDIPGLAFIRGLRPVTYQFDVRLYDGFTGLTQRIVEQDHPEELADYQQAVSVSSSIRRVGFIAQEVDSLAKSLGFDFSGVQPPREDNEHYTIGYEQFVVPLVKAVQEQQEQLDTMLDELNATMLRVELLSVEILERDTTPGPLAHPLETPSPNP